MTIDCRDEELRDLLPAYAHGRLEPAEQLRVESHVARCAECAAELGIIRAARASLARAPMVDTARIVAALPPAPSRPGLRVERGGARPQRRGWWATPSGALRIAAGIGAIAVGGLGLKIATDDRAPVGIVQVRQSTGPTSPAPSSPDANEATGGSSPATGAQQPASTGSAREPGAGAGAPAITGGMTFGGGVSDLSEDELRALLAGLDDLEAVPLAEPEFDLAPVGLGEGR